MVLEASISEGTFPMTYLGVHIKPTKWNKIDCARVVDKISRLISGWGNKHLSFAGRIQLISSVIFGIRNYWMSVFGLPSSITKDIDKLCRHFLWDDKDSKRKMHNIAWIVICRPKKLGGLGFKDGSPRNKISMGKFIWAVSLKHDSLWV